MKLYLDLCCFNRPFDDQSQLLVRLQTEAKLANDGLKAMDSLHVASAIEAGAVCFLTTDKQILRKMKSDSRIQVLDPVDFIRQTEHTEE
jgi:predicted nucleic acid-binding protein